MEYELSEKQKNVVKAFEDLGWTITDVEWQNRSGIGPNCILHYKCSELTPEKTIDITDFDLW